MVATLCALPAGSRRARNQADALAAYTNHPARAELRSDRDGRYAQIWRAIVCRADWQTLTYTGTWEVLAEQAGVSRATIARALRWYRAVGLLGVVHSGASAAVIGGTVNRAPTYVLAVPPAADVSAAQQPVDEIDTPPVGELSVDNQITREAVETTDAPLRGGEIRSSTTEVDAVLAVCPATRRARLAAVEAMQWQDMALRRMSARLLRHLLRPWFDAGWSPRDVLYALNHRPDGQPWQHTGEVHTPAAWMRHRLAPWRGQPSRSQRPRAAVAARPARPAAPASWSADLAARATSPTEHAARRARGAALARQVLARTRAGDVA